MRSSTLVRRLLLAATTFVGAMVASAASTPKETGRQFVVAALANVRGIAIDRSGNLYVTEVATATVHKLTPDGRDIVLPTAGIKSPFGIAVDPHDVVYISDDHSSAVYRLSATGAPESLIKSGDPAGLDDATTLAVDTHGDVFVGDNHHHVIRRITLDGVLQTFAGNVAEAGSTDGVATDARFAGPRGLAIDPSGNLYVADEINCNIRRITPHGWVTTLAGSTGTAGHRDGEGVHAAFGAPRGLAADGDGNVFIADTNNHTIRRLSPNGYVATMAGKPFEPGATDGVGKKARFNQPRAIAIGADGTLYIADNGNASIRQISRDGTVTTVAGPNHP
jgi:streptogramin lyase